jgi:hypothetical protein
MKKDERDELTWFVLELSRAGDRLVREGRFETVLRQCLRCPPEHQVFIPSFTFGSPQDEDSIFFSVAEGYVFLQSGLDEHEVLRLEELPFIRKVLSNRDQDSGIRACLTVSDKDLSELRKKLGKMISSVLTVGMEVSIISGEFAGMKGTVIDRSETDVDIFIELRSLKIVSRIPQSFVRPCQDQGR